MLNKVFKSFFAVALTLGVALGFVACENDEPEAADPTVEVSVSSLNFSNEEGSQTLAVTSNAAWKVEIDYVTGTDWVTVTPMNGNGDASLTVSVPANDTGAIREATIKVIALHPTYGGWETKKVKVAQSATEDVPVEVVALYYDNFDGKEATKTYGKEGSSWPYIDQFTDYANPTGPAAQNVTYSGKGVSVRANSTSNSSYSDYAGSGSNNIFFGSSAQFVVEGLALTAEQSNLRLTFGTEKYTKDGDSTFSTEEFKAYLSMDSYAWTQVEFTFAGTEPGRWNVATADFTLTTVPETLYIKFTASVASVYRLDDVKLETGNGGQQITLEAGEAPTVKKVTVAEFLAAAEDDTIYELTGEITNVANTTYGNFDLTDETGTVLIYGLCSPTGEQKYWAESGAKKGDTITVQTVRTSYQGTPQGKDAIFVSLVPGSGGGEEPTPSPTPGDVTTIAEVLALGNGATISSAVIEGVVISNMELNNLTSKKGLYVQDSTGGLQFYLAANHELAFGTKVQIDLSGATIGDYNGAVQISDLALDKITTVSTGNTVEPKTVTMADFLANKYEGQYIAIDGVQVASADLSKTWVVDDKHTSINIEDAEGNKFVVFSSKYASYGAETVAQGSGTIKGISSISKGAMQIIFAQAGDFAGLTGERFATTEPEPEPEPEPTPDPEPGTGAYTMISKVANLSAGTYFMAGYLTEYYDSSNKVNHDWSSYPYHVCTGVSTDLYTDNYSFVDGELTKDPSITTSYEKSEIELIAVDGKANTYYIKFVNENQYLYSSEAATNRKLGLTDTATEWVATDNANGGITLSSNSVYLGTAGAASKLLRSYKNESTLKYGVVFFKAN